MLHFLATGDAATISVKTSDIPYVLKLASGNVTS